MIEESTKFPADPIEERFTQQGNTISELCERIKDLEGVVSHMVNSLKNFATHYQSPEETTTTEATVEEHTHWFLALPTASDLYLDSYMGVNPEISIKAQYCNGLIIALRGEILSIVYHAVQDSWTSIKPKERESMKATAIQLKRAQQLVEEYENAKSS